MDVTDTNRCHQSSIRVGTYALIGHPIKHSRSQHLFESRFATYDKLRYVLHDIDNLQQLKGWINDVPINGFNVTSPFKQKILPLLDACSPVASSIGAVNCVTVEWIENDSALDGYGGDNETSAKRFYLTGYNTDAQAFADDLCSWICPYYRHALVFGTGGAARAAAYALGQLHIDVRMVSRNPQGDNQIAYDDLPDFITSAHLLINATPLGTANTDYADLSPLPPAIHLSPNNLCYDMVYNPDLTPFLRQALRQGAVVRNGQGMLQRQAEASYRLWGLV